MKYGLEGTKTESRKAPVKVWEKQQSCTGADQHWFEEAIVYTSSQPQVQWHSVDGLKPALVGLSTPQISANTTDQGSLFGEQIYQHTTDLNKSYSNETEEEKILTRGVNEVESAILIISWLMGEEAQWGRSHNGLSGYWLAWFQQDTGASYQEEEFKKGKR